MASEIVSHLRGIPIALWLMFSVTSSSRDLNPSLTMAGLDAISAWSAALQTPIDSPRIQVGDCPATEDRDFVAVACVADDDSINVSPRILHPGMIHVDLRTILLHEVGHVLGVPHIPGDALMEREPRVLLTRPTVDAIRWVMRERD